MGALFRLSLRQLTGKWRLLLLVLLAALPIGLAVVVSLALGEDETLVRPRSSGTGEAAGLRISSRRGLRLDTNLVETTLYLDVYVRRQRSL